jgi:tripartite-type tricarboxylate transporter receptor subunit TctC
MRLPRHALEVCVFVVTVAGLGTAHAQGYPTKPIRMVTAAIGGGADLTARIVAQGLSASLNRQVIVDNRGLTAIEIASSAPPDGYTLLAYGSPLWLAPLTQDNVTWDPLKDFAPITSATNTPNLLVSPASLPVKSVQEFIALARARPGELNYAAGSPGSTSHLGAELFKAMAGANIVHVPYKGNGPALTALAGGQVQMMFANVALVTPHVKSGRLKGLGVTSLKPTELAPGIPTVASALPGYELVTNISVFAPARTPAPVIRFLNQEIVRLLNRPEIKEKALSMGVEAVGSTPEQLTAAMKAEVARFAKVVKDAGIRGSGA